MAIEIHCPNGHKLTCPDHFTGTHVRCPQCGSLTEMPPHLRPQPSDFQHPSEPHPSDSSDSHIDLEHVPHSDEAPTQKQKRAPFASNQISFLCPNGHKLNAPLNLQGRIGQCPHCHVKFRIPVLPGSSPNGASRAPADTPPPAHASSVPGSPAGGPADDTFSPSAGLPESPDAGPISSQISEISPDEIREIAPAMMEMPPPKTDREIPATASSPIGSLLSVFEILWEEQAHGAVVEIHLDEGVVVTPDWWAKKLSNTRYGVFALENRDGSYQMEAIAWERVQRVIVRNIPELPGGLFE
ncbi:MAG: hypothetical protein JW829_01380 [Pirellulales bacterium]|nr:hypothetical protein [Pirellulales bacterium]